MGKRIQIITNNPKLQQLKRRLKAANNLRIAATYQGEAKEIALITPTDFYEAKIIRLPTNRVGEHTNLWIAQTEQKVPSRPTAKIIQLQPQAQPYDFLR